MVENGVPMFKKIKNGKETTFKIEKEKAFYIPGDATHVGIRAGQIAFFISSAWPINYKGRKRKFLKIPEIPGVKGERVDYVIFPEYKYEEIRGHHYGTIEFF